MDVAWQGLTSHENVHNLKVLQVKQKKDNCQNVFKSGEVWLASASVTNIFNMGGRKHCRSSEV